VNLPLHDGVRRMVNGEKILLRGSTTFSNPDQPFWKQIEVITDKFYERVPAAKKHIPILGSLAKNSFVHYGNWYHTPLHRAMASASFIQVKNTKIWHFIHPRYLPVLDAHSAAPGTITSGVCCIEAEENRELMSKIRKHGRIVTIHTEPGDFMYFPPHWWHEVEILNDGIGIMLGFRHVFAKDMLNVIFPFINPERVLPNLHAITSGLRLFSTGALPMVFSYLFTGGDWDGENLRATDSVVQNMQDTLDPKCRKVCKMFEFADS